MAMDKPVEEGKEYEVTIDATGRKGDGIAHLQGFVIIVPGASIGEKVIVKVNSIKQTFCTAEIVKKI